MTVLWRRTFWVDLKALWDDWDNIVAGLERKARPDEKTAGRYAVIKQFETLANVLSSKKGTTGRVAMVYNVSLICLHG